MNVESVQNHRFTNFDRLSATRQTHSTLAPLSLFGGNKRNIDDAKPLGGPCHRTPNFRVIMLHMFDWLIGVRSYCSPAWE